ncbi:restriction endonuclease subunit S [Mycolicibacterium gilvum]|uniref:restriction endonuclease subunit S n=1 Tax=Mycolicibacterium gilvum TaxID=1804 RepID=UPI0040459626
MLIDNNAMAATPSKAVDASYLFRFLQTVDFYRLATSTTVPSLRKSDLERIPMPLPPIEEQRRVAAILDHVDALRVKRRRVLSHLDAIPQAIFLDMFGEFSGKFLTVEEVAAPTKGAIRTGPFGSQLLHGEFVGEGISVLGLDNVVGNQFSWRERRYITPEKYQQLRRYTVHPGDVLVSIMGTCGRCVVVPPNVGTAINTKHICAITLDRDLVLPEFVRAAFLWHPSSRQHLAQRTKGAIMDGLNMGIVKEMPLPVPQVDDQREFVKVVRQLDGLSRSTLQSAMELDNLFTSLQSRAFSGQL